MSISKTDQLEIEQVSTPEGFQIIRINGWITLKNVAALEEAIGKTRGSHTIIDLTGVHYVDSAGLGTLLRGYVGSQKYGGQFVLAGVGQKVRDLLQLTKIESLFRIYATPEEAAAAVAKSAAAGA
ncbi:MAG: STAS domain-containing protein [Terriglobales bacterium]